MIRVGTVPYLNARPLVFGFAQGLAADRVRLESDVPSRLADRLAEGSLDVALLSSIELARIPGLTVVPGLAIGSAGPILSVVLWSKVPLGAIRTLAPDPESRTSNALARLWLGERHGVRPQLVGHAEEADAAVRIGDKALFEPPPAGTTSVDLGEAWTSWTGLPFVYAVWAARDGVLDRELYEAFHASKRRGDAVIPAIAEDHTWRGRSDPPLALRYLERHLRYRLGEAEVAGLRRFLTLAAGSAEIRLAHFSAMACGRMS
jgi:chorismate dehydratase